MKAVCAGVCSRTACYNSALQMSVVSVSDGSICRTPRTCEAFPYGCPQSRSRSESSPQMATCPRCREFLDEGHVCTGLAAQRAKQVVVFGVTALVGLLVGGVLFGLVGEAMAIRELEVVGMVAGPIVAVILVRAIRSV
jgi:hypothetical protein